MASERIQFFIAQAREWWAVADVLRVSRVRHDTPALDVWREAAWCHLLFAIGKYVAALVGLRVIARDVIGVQTDPAPIPSSRDAALSETADLFARMKGAVTARYPAAFGRPVAA